MSRILITGGAGFIGGHFVRYALSQGAERVVNLDALTYAGNRESLADCEGDERYRFVQASIGDSEEVNSLLAEEQIDWIVNFAAESHVDRSIDGPAVFIETNVAATTRLLDSVRRHWENGNKPDSFRFLHVSTDEVYGALGETGEFSETSPYAPNSPYAASKAASDHFVRAWHHTYGLPVLTTNCSNNYGPFQFPEKLIPLIVQKALAGDPLPIYGDGSQVRDWLYVEDHCSAIWRVLRDGRDGEVYNVGGDGERNNLEVVHAICDILNDVRPGAKPYQEQITYVTDRPGHDWRYAIDSTKLQSELGWKPAHSFETGLKETVQWYLDNDEWVQRVLDGSYQGERLGHG